MKEETIIRISVRSLVEFILREGDIDNRVSGSMEKDAMLLGGKIHRKIQSRMGTNYTAEVPLKIQMPCDGFVLQIEGRFQMFQTSQNPLDLIDQDFSVIFQNSIGAPFYLQNVMLIFMQFRIL